ncbi:selenide, water dikinase SelD [Ohtaekwangia koreensis]|uniref:Selenide, water dikinase n=1 Tax=Ohtaekwangia koreensis TaxID=688867 RepID=A0A1T5LL12_9BACT|nr:selenide, water dikinase SelD [Ohtaekwangia koreensis]SKC76610.1 selenophosphate synthase [Ohtaekwangia koreensis]
MEPIKLTQYSHGAGCGCKISPAVLETILHSDAPKAIFPELLVGNESKDDAAVYDIGDGMCIVSTTDFFMPIVDDPATFGAIASVNAISDIYAMGGEPFMAIAILGWPINKIPAEVAKGVLEGSRKVCLEAEIPLAGGHSIDCPEPVFGLAVTGKLKKENLKRNDTARANSLLYLTKSLGIGIITTAQKKGIVQQAHYQRAVDSMLTLNWLGAEVGKLKYVSAMTDVTGFGLLGHLCEVCEGSGLSAEIEFNKVPVFDFLEEYIQQKSMPGGTTRNWESYGSKISPLSEKQKVILSDPQTSGGLLIVVDEEKQEEFEKEMQSHDYTLKPFGRLTNKEANVIEVK